MRYRRGDELVLKVEDNFGYHDTTYRRAKVQIIGHNVDSDGDDAEYLVYVPPYESVPNSWTLTERHLKWYQVERKFLGDTVAFVRARHPIFKHIPAPVGEKCDHCQEFYDGAVRGEDNVYMCRACRLDPYR